MTSEQFWEYQMKFDKLNQMSDEDYDKITDDFVSKVLEKSGDITHKVKPKPEYEPPIPYEEMSVEEANEEFQKINDKLTEGEKKLVLNTPMSMKLNKKLNDDETWDEFIVDDVNINDLTVKKTDMTVGDIDDMLNKYNDKYGWMYEDKTN